MISNPYIAQWVDFHFKMMNPWFSGRADIVINSGFTIQQIAEPKFSDKILKKYPEMEDELRRPIFIMISAIKKG